MIFSPFTLWGVVCPFTFMILILLYLYILLPITRLQFYKKQGIKTIFYPIIGMIKMMRQNIITKGDFLAESKESSKTDLDTKAVASVRGTNVILLLRDPKYMKEFLLNPSYYQKSRLYYIFKLLMGDGLLFGEGQKWKVHRKIISASFNYDFISSKTILIQETTREFLEKIPVEEYKNCSVMDRIQEITGEVVGRIFFGRNLNRYSFEGKTLTLSLASLMSEIGVLTVSSLHFILGKKLFLIPGTKAKRLTIKMKAFRDICNRIIEDRRSENKSYDDLLNALLAQQCQEASNEIEKITNDDIINEFLTFFAAGMDTTGHLVTMTLYNLTQHPEYLAKLKEEREASYNKVKPLDAEIIQNMNVLNCFLKETLRHHTPAPLSFAREALEDHKILDLEIRKGTAVRTDVLGSFFDAKHFQDPEAFKPERWQSPNQKLDPFAFIPFSAGPRNCIGQHLAMQETKIIVSEFLEKFDFKLSEGYKLRMVMRFLYEPLQDLKLDLIKKQ